MGDHLLAEGLFRGHRQGVHAGECRGGPQQALRVLHQTRVGQGCPGRVVSHGEPHRGGSEGDPDHRGLFTQTDIERVRVAQEIRAQFHGFLDCRLSHLMPRLSGCDSAATAGFAATSVSHHSGRSP